MQKDALDRARAAFKEGNYSRALEQYEYFFDHALDDDPHSLYGVRLSYCLAEWVRLGELYPEALQRLEQKSEEALVLLGQTREPERFHDFVAICKYLKRDEDPIECFLGYHSSDRDLAKSVIRFIWDELVDRGFWTVCAEYLPEPKKKYQVILSKFDKALQVCKSNPSLGGDEFEEQIKTWYVRDVTNLLLVLKNTSNIEGARSIQEAMTSDMQFRGYSDLVGRINERILQ